MYNKIIIVGNLSKDIELRYTQSGQAICRCGVATNKKHKGQDGSVQNKAMFIEFKAFGRTAEVLNQFCKKGDRILIEGELELEQWTTQEGQARQKHVVLAQAIQMMNNKQEQTQEQVQPRPEDYEPQNQAPSQAPVQSNTPTLEISDDEIPF